MTLSIVTICYNDLDGLKRTIDSVLSQTVSPFEHVLIDGGSSDGSTDRIKEYSHSAGFTVKWKSEPDTGIFNAMNKGVALSSGDYLLFLNSGDVLDNDAVISSFISSNSSSDVVSGKERRGDDVVSPPYEDELSYHFFFNNTLLHQSTFIRRDAFDRFGFYSEEFKIVSDWEWFFRTLIKENATYDTLDFIVSNYDMSGISRNPRFSLLQEIEREQVHSLLIPRVKNDYEKIMSLTSENNEYRLLQSGRFGFIVRFLLWLKRYHKRLG